MFFVCRFCGMRYSETSPHYYCPVKVKPLDNAFKVGDLVRWKRSSGIEGRITEIDGDNYVIDNCIVLKSSEMEYKNVDIPVQSLPWGNKQKCNCDWNEVLRYGCKNPNHC